MNCRIYLADNGQYFFSVNGEDSEGFQSRREAEEALLWHLEDVLGINIDEQAARQILEQEPS